MKKSLVPNDAPKNKLVRSDPKTSAALFRAQVMPTLINFQDEWLAYKSGAYSPVEHRTVLQAISRWASDAVEMVVNGNGKLVSKPFRPKPSDLATISDMLKSDYHVPNDTMAPPVFLDGGTGDYAELDPKNLISCSNGLLDISTRRLYPPSEQFFTFTCLPVEYDELALDPEKWLAFLGQITRNRKPMIELMQETIGYLVSPQTRMQRAFFLYGPPRCGKGTTLRIVDALIGPRNVCSPSIENLAGRFGFQGCIGKSLIQVTDMDCDNRQSLGTAATKINAVSGEDRISAERKGLETWEGTLGGRFLMAGNGLPNFGSHMSAMSARLLIVPLDTSFEGREDYDLTSKLMAELSGILNWALDGLDRLTARGRFVEPEDSKTAKLAMLYQADPVHGFVDEHCTIERGATVDKMILYDAFTSFCQRTGAFVPPLNKFSERLGAFYRSVQPSRRRVKGGQVHCFRGLRLNDATAAKIYRLDHEMTELLGVPAFQLDAAGFPVPCEADLGA